MAMAEPTTAELVAQCTRFLAMDYPRTIRDRLQEIAASPLALEFQDRYGQGGVVSQLESECAELFGKEAAVFMPSGTMAQQIALRIWADEASNPRVAFHPTCHLEIHEQMAYQEIHHLQPMLLGEAHRLFTLEDLPSRDTPISTLLIELPQREIGGQLPTWDQLQLICNEIRSRGSRVHMDGARLWECAPYFERRYAEIAGLFDSVYVSFYKALGGLPGAVLAGPQQFIAKARIWQRRHGGNLHQQAANAISAKLGMQRELPLIESYVKKANEVAAVLREFDEVRVVPEMPPTNMMHLHFKGDPEKLGYAARRIATEDHVFLFLGLGPDGKLELTVGSATLDLSAEEIRAIFTKLFDLAGR